ncbi:MAG TPA: hypothetical protein VGQ58_04900 [Candidatus Limnocylindrales bacterium]|jgi:hypothetical protein|nr:hypothetical protein [Candidatus Limnocylindrales bacterium]
MRWLARLLLLRILPRKLLPILTVWEFWKIVRGRQEARDRARRAAAARGAVSSPAPSGPAVSGPGPSGPAISGPATRRPPIR